MSNHYHLVLKIDRERAQALSETEVTQRWARLFNLPLLVERYRAHEAITADCLERQPTGRRVTVTEDVLTLFAYLVCLP